MVTREQAEFAASWWAEQLRHIPEHHTDIEGFKELAIWPWLTGKITVPSEKQIAIFQRELAAYLVEEPSISLKSDWEPDVVLRAACIMAKIDMPRYRFPVKTSMFQDWLDKTIIWVRHGDGRREQVYP